MDNRCPPENRFLAESDTLDRRLRRSGMLPEVTSRGYMTKSQLNPRLKSCRCYRRASRGRDMQRRGSVEGTFDKARLEQSRVRGRIGMGSFGRGHRVRI